MESEMVKKKKKVEEIEEDRISSLPDAIIQHILSFLPSTRQAVQTTVLSNRWRNQWTRVPVLIFDIDGMSRKNFIKSVSGEKYLQFVDNALLNLHDCPKIHKFHLQYPYFSGKDPQFAEKIRFVTSKYVEDLNLSSYTDELLPDFIFNYASLVKFSARYCSFRPKENVNWGCLSSLEIDECKLPYLAMKRIVSGSPSLKSFKLAHCDLKKIVIASKSLKRLVIHSYNESRPISVVEFSCPNLEELSLRSISTRHPQMLAQAIENVLSLCSLLKSLELSACPIMREQLVIVSKSLKRFVLEEHCDKRFDFEISCPQLEELKLLGFLKVNSAKFLNLPSSLCATIDFFNCEKDKACKSLIMEIMQQLQNFKELTFGGWFTEILLTTKMGGQFSPVLNIKCLTVDSPSLVRHHSEIACLLHISPVLEKFVVNVREPRYCEANHRKIGKNCWDSNLDVFDCLVSHLKTIEIMGFPERVGRRENLLSLVKFLLKNGKVLEKMVVILKKDHIGTSSSDLSQELLSLPRGSQNAIIKVLCFS